MPRRYKPVKAARLFTKNVGYHQINWNTWSDVIRRFEQQLHWWYVTPIKQLRKRSAHNGFAVVALGCVLIDAMSQYCAGVEQSSGFAFKGFVRNRLPSRGTRFAMPIRIWNEKTNKEGKARDFADVLWKVLGVEFSMKRMSRCRADCGVFPVCSTSFGAGTVTTLIQASRVQR